MSFLVTDQMGNQIEVPNKLTSIISLVPSQTELLFDLGAGDLVKGITKFCIHPADEIKSVEKVGGTKNFNFDKIKSLCPDLIIGNKEENYKEGIEKLSNSYPIWMSDISNLKDALEMISQVSQLVDKQLEGNQMVESIQKGFKTIKRQKRKRVLYFIWRKPFMVVGKGTFIDDMLSKIGLINIADQKRYPELSREQIKDMDPELILLSSEPYPFKAKHFNELKEICPKAAIHIIDGEMFSWYGSRLLKAPDYFNSLLL